MKRLMRRSTTAGAVVLVLSVAALGSACGTTDDKTKDASADVVDATTTTADATTTTVEDGASGSVDVSGVELPRKVNYAGLEITVEGAEAVTDEDDGPGVALELTVRNLLKETAQILPTSIGLVDGDGGRMLAIGFNDPADPARGNDATSPVEIIADGKVERTAFVPVEGELDLAAASLSVAEEEKIPAEVPLSGDIPKSAFPAAITVPTEPVQLYSQGPLTLTLESAELAEEYGPDRAPAGSHFVVLKVSAIGDECSGGCGGASLSGETVRLVVDGTPLVAAISDPVSCCGIAVGAGADLTLVYELPDEHTEVSMLGSSSDLEKRPEHTYAITIPELPGD